MQNINRRAFLAATGAAMALAALSGGAHAQAPDDALIRAAKAEGQLLFYTAATENIARRVAEAFNTKYGIKASFLRLSSTNLLQRYATEAEAGTFAGDLLFGAGSTPVFAGNAVAKGWAIPVSKADIPAVTSGAFPAKFMRENTAIVQIQPWVIGYNSDLIKQADAPKTWTDLLAPKYKGQIIMTDPGASDAYLDFFRLLLDHYGPDFFTKLNALTPRRINDGVAGTQSLGAGEVSFQVPINPAQASSIMDRGAPIKIIIPDLAVGVEMQIMMTNPAKAKHPAAARLFADYIMRPEGNALFNQDFGSVSVFDTSKLPKQYESPKPDTLARKDELRKLAGF